VASIKALRNVSLGVRVLPDIAARRQRGEQPVHGALAEPERVRELGDPELRALDAERLENSEGVVDRTKHARHLFYLATVPRCRTAFRGACAS
jgi:hypothetical protein